MTTKVQKWGNSLALRIPRSFAEEARVREGTEVNFTVREGVLIIKPAKPAKYTLRRLMKKVTKKNLHAEVGTGPAVGRETW